MIAPVRGEPMDMHAPEFGVPKPGARPVKKRRGLAPNRERKNRMRGEDVYAAFHRWVADNFECSAKGHPKHECAGAVTGHHLVPVGRGGKDLQGEVPACAQLHAECEDQGHAWVERRYRINLEEIAERIVWRWLKFAGDVAGSPSDEVES